MPASLGETSPTTPVPCLRYTGVPGGHFHHPDGVCACFRGGPGPHRGTGRPGDGVPEQRASS